MLSLLMPAESLYQNNLAMRQQLGLMVQWSQQQKQGQQQRLVQAMRQLAILQRENEALKQNTAVRFED